ncbi:phenylalanine--tRNA ligase subunit beta [Patescibacteria group bacterium]|nr:phenylalanine--tRNA ligase subunit beta [Patescibacteria group bacterium]
MKVSRAWLQKYFDTELPPIGDIAEALTFHAFEIEEVVGDVMDIKVLPDRAAYALSHRGISREIGAILDLTLIKDPLAEAAPTFEKSEALIVSIEDSAKCPRYMSALVRGLKVGLSPVWLKEALESLGQRSINNIVDATNYVMLDIGQPLHAFDAAKLSPSEGTYSINVRGAHQDEKITTLTGEDYVLSKGTLLIVDANADAPIGVAGVKGGKAAEITARTTDIIIESANFDATAIRLASQRLKLWTDASLRFQNKPSPELAAYGMQEVLSLIIEIAGGELEGVTDVYEAPAKPAPVSVTLTKINDVLGSSFSTAEVAKVFERLGLSYTHENEAFVVTPPFERRDIIISEDLVEEVGRIFGYDRIAPQMLPSAESVSDQSRYRGIERIKDFFSERGFIELSTQTFARTGDIALANPLDQTRPMLRMKLSENMRESLQRAEKVAPGVLGPVKDVRLFEIGTIFKSKGESLSLVLGIQFFEKKNASILAEVIDALHDEFGIDAKDFIVEEGVAEMSLDGLDFEKLGIGYEPQKIALGTYHPFSIYPFALRDVAVWTPAGTEEDEVANSILREAGELLARIDLFDRFTKASEGTERISYAFRLVFESFDRTLSDEDLNPLMEKITAVLNADEGWEVR